MSDLTLYFDCEPTADAGTLQGELKTGLQQIAKIANAETSETTTRFTGLEILAAVTLAAGIVHQGASIVHDVRMIVDDLKAVFKEVSALTETLRVKKVRVPVGMAAKPIDELKEEDYEIIARDLVAELEAG